LVRSAAVHQLTVIGEAVARLSSAVRDRHPEIPWTDIKGLWNVVVHNCHRLIDGALADRVRALDAFFFEGV
jgi:uncharacterized protein with HEPN domain